MCRSGAAWAALAIRQQMVFFPKTRITTPTKSRLWPLQGFALMDLLGYNPGEKRGPGQLLHFEGPPPASSRTVHLNMQGVKHRQWEANKDEQVAPV